MIFFPSADVDNINAAALAYIRAQLRTLAFAFLRFLYYIRSACNTPLDGRRRSSPSTRKQYRFLNN